MPTKCIAQNAAAHSERACARPGGRGPAQAPSEAAGERSAASKRVIALQRALAEYGKLPITGQAAGRPPRTAAAAMRPLARRPCARDEIYSGGRPLIAVPGTLVDECRAMIMRAPPRRHINRGSAEESR